MSGWKCLGEVGFLCRHDSKEKYKIWQEKNRVKSSQVKSSQVESTFFFLLDFSIVTAAGVYFDVKVFDTSTEERLIEIFDNSMRAGNSRVKWAKITDRWRLGWNCKKGHEKTNLPFVKRKTTNSKIVDDNVNVYQINSFLQTLSVKIHK